MNSPHTPLSLSSTYLTSFPPCANDPKVAVKICRNENSLLTFSSSTAGFFLDFPWLINGTLLELAEILALTLWWFIPSRLIPLSTLSKQLFAVVVVILLLMVDVIRSLVPALRMMLGGSVRSLTESFLPRPLSFCSESGGDGVRETSLGGERWLFLKNLIFCYKNCKIKFKKFSLTFFLVPIWRKDSGDFFRWRCSGIRQCS